MDIFSVLGDVKRWAGEIFKNNNLLNVGNEAQPITSVPSYIPQRPNIPTNVERLHDAFSTTEMSDRSGGKIKPMTRQGASGLAGNYVVETGDPTLKNTDVIEEDAKAGRGLAQYTHSRRVPYDAARLAYIRKGGDPNDINFQLQYAAEEYAGKHDPAPSRSLIGWTGSLEGETDGMTPAQSATHFRQDFFRPRVPHNDWRVDHAQRIDRAIQQRDARLERLSTHANLKNSSMAHVGHRGADGRYWAGDIYGWQSPESFKKLIGY